MQELWFVLLFGFSPRRYQTPDLATVTMVPEEWDPSLENPYFQLHVKRQYPASCRIFISFEYISFWLLYPYVLLPSFVNDIYTLFVYIRYFYYSILILYLILYKQYSYLHISYHFYISIFEYCYIHTYAIVQIVSNLEYIPCMHNSISIACDSKM